MSFDLESRLGAIPSEWDSRNYRVDRATLLMAQTLPERMLDLMFYVRRPRPSQGNIGTCVGHDGDEVIQITNHLEDKTPVNTSGGWLYYWSRKHSVPPVPDWQEGSTNLGLVRALNKLGATTEECCPTDTVAPFDIEWCEEAKTIAKLYAIDEYWNVNNNPVDIKAAMMGWTHEANYKMPDGSPGKIPLISAFPVYDSFKESYHNGGVVPMPKPGDRLLGGHSSPIAGWDIIDDGNYWTNPGSWGPDIGDKGDFHLPEDYPFYRNDWWLIHNGPPTNDPDDPSPCKVGKGAATLANLLPWVLGRRGRFSYRNPR